ncbi:hypothetical protein [Propioniciclava sp.]|uniref:hypothetical protein n=1 Tax=Propioniciclava sp. TaxID=2038686 RepID=UPI002634782C|nr:hypothetical protein [Propioniciclava sp.]
MCADDLGQLRRQRTQLRAHRARKFAQVDVPGGLGLILLCRKPRPRHIGLALLLVAVGPIVPARPTAVVAEGTPLVPIVRAVRTPFVAVPIPERTPLTAVVRAIRTPLPPLVGAVRTPLPPVLRPIRTPLAPIVRAIRTPLTPLVRAVRTPFVAVPIPERTPLTAVVRAIRAPLPLVRAIRPSVVPIPLLERTPLPPVVRTTRASVPVPARRRSATELPAFPSLSGTFAPVLPRASTPAISAVTLAARIGLRRPPTPVVTIAVSTLAPRPIV